MYLEQINGPEDVKKLSGEQLTQLADEMRQALFCLKISFKVRKRHIPLSSNPTMKFDKGTFRRGRCPHRPKVRRNNNGALVGECQRSRRRGLIQVKR